MSPAEFGSPTNRSPEQPKRHAITASLLQAAAAASAHESGQHPQRASSVDSGLEDEGDGFANEPNDQQSTNEETKRAKRSRACQACRNMKIRCNPVEGQEACKACAKVNRTCIMPGPARKRQKTVHKVAELEKKINLLTQSLQATRKQSQDSPIHQQQYVTALTSPPQDSPMTEISRTGRDDPMMTSIAHQQVLDCALPPQPPTPLSSHHQPSDKRTYFDTSQDKRYPEYHTDTRLHPMKPYTDVIERGILSHETATQVFNRFREEMNPFCPLVVFSSTETTFASVRHQRPMLFLSIMGVACGPFTPEIQSDLFLEVARQLADRVMFYNEKSLDLIQAMLVFASWYGRHKYAKDLGFNQYIHSGVVMALDLGFGKRSRTSLAQNPADDAEMRRTWLSCYYSAMSVSATLRLPPLIQYSPYIEECLQFLSTYPAAVPEDATLCAMVKMQRILEDVALLFHMNDPVESIPLEESRTQYHLKLFEKRLSEWKKESKDCMIEPMLTHTSAISNLYMHEIALHQEHNVDDFRPPYRRTGRETDYSSSVITPHHLDSLTSCMCSIKEGLDNFLALDQRTFCALPCLYMVWTAYATVAMIRLHGLMQAPDSKYADVFLPNLRVDWYLDAIIQKLSHVAQNKNHPPSVLFLQAFQKLKVWHMHRTTGGILPEKVDDLKSSVRTIVDEGMGRGMRTQQDTSIRDGDRTNSAQILVGLESQPSATFASTNRIDFQQQHGLNQFAPQQEQNVHGSALLDSNANIDASTFDIQNWDFNLDELNNFDMYMMDAPSAWLGYLM